MTALPSPGAPLLSKWSGTSLWLLLWLTGAVIALMIPARPFDYYILELLVAVVGAAVPAVRRVGALSSIGPTAQVYWSVMWIWVLLWLPLFFRLSDEQIRPLALARRHPVAFRFSAIVPIVAFVYLYFLPFYGSSGKAMLGSVWGLALTGSMVFAVLPLCIRALGTWHRYLPILEPVPEPVKSEGDPDV